MQSVLKYILVARKNLLISPELKAERNGESISSLQRLTASLSLSLFLPLFPLFQLVFFFFSAANRYHSTRSISFPFVCPTNSSISFFYCFSAPYSSSYTFGPLLLCCDFLPRRAHLLIPSNPFHYDDDKTRDNKLKPFNNFTSLPLLTVPRTLPYLKATFDDLGVKSNYMIQCLLAVQI